MPLRRHLYPGGSGYRCLITWELISAVVRHVRAGGRCEWCGPVNGSEVLSASSGRSYRVILTVAHLDHDTSNSLDPENLAALCQRCHLTYDAPMKHARRRHGEYQGELWPLDVPAAVAAIQARLGLGRGAGGRSGRPVGSLSNHTDVTRVHARAGEAREAGGTERKTTRTPRVGGSASDRPELAAPECRSVALERLYSIERGDL
ncbi:MAG: HNH endonuclease [Actinomycetota bacterium]